MERPAELTAAPPAAWSFACPDWKDRLKSGRSLVPDLPLDRQAADRAVAIFNKLRLPDVVGNPPLKSAAGEWLRDIVRAVFGSIETEEVADPNGAGTIERSVRRCQEVFALVPKKNSKTTGGAAMMLVALLVNERPRAEFIFIGPTQQIADEAFQQASGMIDADPEGYLQKRFHVQEHKKTIIDRRTKATLRIKTFDMKVVTGSKPVGILIDELHVLSSVSYATRVLRQIRGGMIANREAFLIIITTQSDQRPSGVFKAELGYAREVRDGAITSGVRTLPVLYEFPGEMQLDPAKPWNDPRHWPMVLPNLGRPFTIGDLVGDAENEAKKGAEQFQLWASQHLNIEIGLATHGDRWRGADYWEAAADDTITLDSLLARSEVVTVGVDGGGLDDLLGLAVLGRCRTTREWLMWNRAWVQDDVLTLRKEIAERLEDFARDGDLVLCSEPTQDVEELADIIARINDAGLLPERFGVGLDPVGISAIIDALAERGVETEANGGPACAVAQGYKLSGAVWGLERKLKDGTFWHSGSEMMAWCVSNAKTEQRGNAVLITKETAGKAKIDPLIAGFNAFMLMSRGPMVTSSGSYLDAQDLIVL